MHAETLKKLQDIGGFVLASGCTKKTIKQVAEMIRAARDYRFIAIYKIVNNEFVILAGTGKEPPAYPRFPITQGLCGAALESAKPIVVGDVLKDPRYLPAFHTTRSEIIVPMINEHKQILGMLGAESDKVNAFGDDDRKFLDRSPGRLAVFAAWREERFKTTTLRETLARQSGMYRVAAKISDEQINDVVGTFCRSAGGCLRTILWRREASGSVASSKLPPAKFDPNCDQAQALSEPGSATPATTAPTVIPLLCQE